MHLCTSKRMVAKRDGNKTIHTFERDENITNRLDIIITEGGKWHFGQLDITSKSL